jgi:hypothetical protein
MPEVPAGIASVVLSGRYIRPDGTPLQGTITFEPPASLVIASADIISVGNATAELDSSGFFTVTLIATDAPGAQPADWTYTVVERLRHARGRTFHIALPAATPVVNLADIAPTAPSEGDYVLITGPAGQDGATIHNGTGAPANATGNDGDYYIDTTTGAVKLYGPKSGGTWPSSGVGLNGVSSVNDKTGIVSLTASDVGADASGAASAAVSAHASATDPHGDRAWASGLFLEKAGGTLTGGLVSDLSVRSAFFKTTSETEHCVTIVQGATSGASGVALNVSSLKSSDSAMYLSGRETARGTLKIAHLNGGTTATDDAGAAAISIDLQRFGKGGTAAQGLFLTATEGPTTGRLLVLRNSDPTTTDDFVVSATGLTGIRIPVGNVPAAALEVRQRDTSTVGALILGAAGTTQPIFQVKNSGGTATFEVGTSGAVVFRAVSFYTNSLQLGSTSSDLGGSAGAVISMKNVTTAPTTNPTGGVILYAVGGRLKLRLPDGTDQFVALTAT